jgi:hypothetical protein
VRPVSGMVLLMKDATQTKACREMLRTWTFTMDRPAYLRWLRSRDIAIVHGKVGRR